MADIIVNNLPINVSPTINDLVMVIKNSDGTLTNSSLSNIGALISGVVWITYGTATNADITAVYNTGKIVACKRDTRIYFLTYHDEGTWDIFTAWDMESPESPHLYEVSCYLDTWSNSSYVVPQYPEIIGAQPAPSTAGTAGQVLGLDNNLNPVWVNQTGGGGTPYDSNPQPLGTASPGVSGNFSRGDHVHAMPSAADVGAYTKPSGGIPKSDLASAVQTSLGLADGALQKSGGTMTGAVAMGGYKVTGLGTPQNDGDASTKKYVDDAIAGLGTVFNIKGDVATVSNLPASGNSVGDVYYVQSVQAAYIWLETTAHPAGYWEEFGEPIDLSGYIQAPQSPSNGQFLQWNGSAWVAASLPVYNGGVS